MKIKKIENINYFIVIIIAVLLVMLTGCNNKNDDDISNKLESPQNLTLTKEEYLKWDKVENAKGYTVSIQQINSDTKTYDVKDNEFDIFELLDEVGEYNLSVIAYNDSFKSDMSDVINYQIKDQADQFDYRLMSNSYYRASPKKGAVLEGKLVFPKEYNGLPVNEIDHIKEFHNITGAIYSDTVIKALGFTKCNNLRRIKFSPNMDVIYSETFVDLINIKELVFPEGVERLFGNSISNLSSLKTIKFSKTVKNLGNPLFKECYELENIDIPDDNPYFKCINNYIIEKETERIVYGNPYYEIPECAKIIGKSAFVAFTSLTELTIPGHIKRIEANAFTGTNYRKIIIEEGVEQIGEAFKSIDQLEEIFLPSTLIYLANSNFQEAKGLKKIEFPNGNSRYKVENNCLVDTETKTLMVGYGTTPIIPSDVEVIGNSAFEGSALTQIHIPSNVKTINTVAFRKCYNLTSVTFDEGVEEIKVWAFAYCPNVDQIILPKSLKIIGQGIFTATYCTVYLYNTIESIQEFAFKNSTVYTDLDYNFLLNDVDINNSNYFNGCSICTDCDISKGYLYSYTYHENSNSYLSKKNNKIGGYSIWGNMGYAQTTDIIEIPYRDGYEFKGFSYTKDSKEIDVELEYKYFEYDDLYNIDRGAKRYCYSIKFPKTLTEGTILYAVWEKTAQ